jgi:hypothetical protein
MGRSYEVIFINDGSRDRSAALLREQFQQRPAHPCPDECTDPATGAPIPGVVANAGKFESSFDIVSLGVDLRL